MKITRNVIRNADDVTIDISDYPGDLESDTVYYTAQLDESEDIRINPFTHEVIITVKWSTDFFEDHDRYDDDAIHAACWRAIMNRVRKMLADSRLSGTVTQDLIKADSAIDGSIIARMDPESARLVTDLKAGIHRFLYGSP
jgi:hypothetical protein